MNEEDILEELLKRQHARPIPKSWRKEILAAAKRSEVAPDAVRDVPLLSTESFWPSPMAWAGLGCVWVLILALNLTTPDDKSALMANGNSLSLKELQFAVEQRRTYANIDPLSDPLNHNEVAPPKPAQLGPRSERQKSTGVG